MCKWSRFQTDSDGLPKNQCTSIKFSHYKLLGPPALDTLSGLIVRLVLFSSVLFLSLRSFKEPHYLYMQLGKKETPVVSLSTWGDAVLFTSLDAGIMKHIWALLVFCVKITQPFCYDRFQSQARNPSDVFSLQMYQSPSRMNYDLRGEAIWPLSQVQILNQTLGNNCRFL